MGLSAEDVTALEHRFAGYAAEIESLADGLGPESTSWSDRVSAQRDSRLVEPVNPSTAEEARRHTPN
jgi:hypothetical protein